MSEPESKLVDALLARVRAVTSEHGARKALADKLGISPTMLSAYLADPPTRRPNAETTLQLQEWLKKQKK